MISRDAADWSIGANGIAWADTDIKHMDVRPSANTVAARIFIGCFLSSGFRRDAAQSDLRKRYGSPVTSCGVVSASGGDANGDASDAAANPSAGGANASAGANVDASGHDDANAPAPA